MTSKQVIIVGCGIAGTSLAFALKKCGINSTIYESEKTPNDHAGLYLYLGSNGMNVLKSLDLQNEIQDVGFFCDNMVFRNNKEKIIAEVNTNQDKSHYGSDGLIIKRGLFQKFLREKVISNNIQIEWNKKLESIKTDNDVVAKFKDNSDAKGDLLIGCDGLHSKTRQIIFPDAPLPKYTGVVLAGGISKNQSKTPTNQLTFRFGSKVYLNYFVTSDREAMWGAHMKIKQDLLSDLTSVSSETWKQKILDKFSDDSSYVSEFIENASNLTKLPLYDIESLPSWYKGSVCLVGDSAHTTTPHAGQGASLALESALTLARCLRDTSDTEDAFSKYQSQRKPRVEKMIALARRQGEMFTATNPIKKWFRNSILSMMIKKNSQMFDEIYDYKVDW